MKLSMQEKLTLAAQRQADDHKVAQHRVDMFNRKTPQAASPPTEPLGKAPMGEGFSK
jgi:hypothetical protein